MMDVDTKLSVPETVMQPLLNNSSTLDKGLEHLIEIGKSPGGRAELASKDLCSSALSSTWSSLQWPPSFLVSEASYALES